MTINTYKPNDSVRIEAMLFEDEVIVKSYAGIWAGDDLHYSGPVFNDDGHIAFEYRVKTLEGWVDMSYGSYLCKGTSGGFYPCDPDEFEKRWVQV